MPALCDDDLTLFGGRGDWETDPLLTLDPGGFDRVSATLCYRGTPAELHSLFALGGKTCPSYAGRPLYFSGAQVKESMAGYQVAELTWAGMASLPWQNSLVNLLSDNVFLRSLHLTMTTEENLFPREVNGNTLYLKSPYAPPPSVGGGDGLRTFTAISPAGAVITTGQLPWRVRLIGRAWNLKMSGIIAGPRSSIIKPPLCNIQDPAATSISTAPGATAINWLSTGDPLVTYSADKGANDGWVCRNYETSQEQPLGDIVLAKWEAYYEWVERYGP